MSTQVAHPQLAATPPSSPGAGLALPSAIRRRLRGELGQVPVLLALFIIALYSQFATQGNFLRPRNLTEMIQEIITIGTLALGSAG
jgi:ABC-type xylose transport system permease subunit